MKPKPCPICGSEPRADKDSGIECYGCGLWLGAGAYALDYWRKLRGDPYLKAEDGWIIEVWNSRHDSMED